MKRVTTLCLVRKDDKLLLGMKKRGFGVGRWNGFGGKLHDGESIESAANRELQEEAGLTATELEKRAVINFVGLEEGDKNDIEVHLFDILEYEGELAESEEMLPKWFGLEEIPYESMWPDDTFWLPVFLEGKKFMAEFIYKNSEIMDHKIEIVEKI